MAQTFYWHDYETFGTDPARDWPAQFAGIRTDADFNEIGEPLNIFCRLPGDQLPHPEACLVTGLTPDKVNRHGVCEADFIERIYQELAQPNTCALGYNSIRFDDEVTRHSLYRNFHEPYGREWQNGCSRWDIIDVVRLCAALRPDGIVWPKREDGSNSFKLEQLTEANGIAHLDAHDALSDVRATIAMAKLLQNKQPRLFSHALNHRLKWQVARELDTVSSSPKAVIHVSGKYSADRHCLAVVAPLAMHPSRNNEVIVYDLSVDPEPLLALDAEQVHHRIFTSSSELETLGIERVPLKTIRLNRCPIVVPLKVMGLEDQERLGVSLQRCQQNYDKIFSQSETIQALRNKLMEVFSGEAQNASDDPDHMLYSGGFFSNDDRAHMTRVKNTAPEQLAGLVLPFRDERLDEMLFRYRARNWPELLKGEDLARWDRFWRQRIKNGCGGNSSGLTDYLSHLHSMINAETDAGRKSILTDLLSYVDRLEI